MFLRLRDGGPCPRRVETTWHGTEVLKRDAPERGCWRACRAASVRRRGVCASQADRQQHRALQPQGAKGRKQRKLAGQQQTVCHASGGPTRLARRCVGRQALWPHGLAPAAGGRWRLHHSSDLESQCRKQRGGSAGTEQLRVSVPAFAVRCSGHNNPRLCIGCCA